MPIAIKDNFCTSEMPTTCGSAMLKDFASPYNATVVDLLQQAGAKLLGKTNMDEFGMGSANIYSESGPVYNPWEYKSNHTALDDPSQIRVAGGSSGGSAAAVAMDMCTVALGSDTGGSVRLPAAYCGVVGYKPSYGQVSRNGLVAYANSLDTVGLIGRSVPDISAVYDVLSHHDEKDPTSMPTDLRTSILNQEKQLVSHWQDSQGGGDLSGLRVGIPNEYYVDQLSTEVLDTWRSGIKSLRDRGASIIPVSLPHTRYALPAYYIIALAEASSNLARFDGVCYGHHSEKVSSTDLIYADTRSEGFGSEVQRRILLGTHVLTAGTFESHFLPAQQARRLIMDDFNKVFLMRNDLDKNSSISSTSTLTPEQQVHVLLTPSSISTAPTLQQSLPDRTKNNSDGVVDAYVNDVMTVPVSLAGLPAITLPSGRSLTNGYPIGLQLICQYGYDRFLLDVSTRIAE
ncbi:amidase signature enzyme [Chlamydoabsidia padenii]|nr:amidase signature enzyme [Chlamydoabsidia padenii]